MPAISVVPGQNLSGLEEEEDEKISLKSSSVYMAYVLIKAFAYRD